MTQTWMQLLAEMGVMQSPKCYCRGCNAEGTHQLSWCYSDDIDMRGGKLVPRVKHPSDHWLCDRHWAHWRKATS